MYFLSDIEQKLLLNKLLPSARKAGVSEDLRGWSWNRSPMMPFYDKEKVPMYLVCSKYCPVNRDVFLSAVMGRRGRISYEVSVGLGLHGTISAVLNAFLGGDIDPSFEEWWMKNYHYISNQEWVEPMKHLAKQVWEHTLANSRSALFNKSAEQPYASQRDTLATAIPFLIHHKISGTLLGLSGLLAVDCYDYLRSIVYDVKVADDKKDWYRLYPTGYALVLESVYEVPVDIGGVIYISFKNGKLIVERELFTINDDHRQWWLEERDTKLEIVGQKKDPGIPPTCYDKCIHQEECKG
nr:type I-A CRISPR-associated protein Cas4/Csa1 [Candidatus Njordarchaeota archaeon]